MMDAQDWPYDVPVRELAMPYASCFITCSMHAYLSFRTFPHAPFMHVPAPPDTYTIIPYTQ